MIHPRRALLILLAALVLTSPAVCQERGAITSPEEGGIDFRIQGEYVGTTSEGERWGVQVIALGDGEFRAVGHRGGLPGDGWDGEERRSAEGRLQGEVAVFEGEGFTLRIDGKSITITNSDGDRVLELEKVERKSPTLEAKPPEGAIVLFDGSSTDGWHNARLVMDKLLGATNCYTERTFGDHELHIEFRTPFMPKARGQGRGNSGVYVQSRYEVQVLDSFGLEGKDNECGGIYSISPPDVNMCLPPLSWQTYDIVFTAARYDDQGNKTSNARITVKHNGVVIHDDRELPHGTPGRMQEGPEPAPLFLQDHGNPVVFRNIWVVPK